MSDQTAYSQYSQNSYPGDGMPMRQPQQGNGLAIAGLVLGIISIFTWWFRPLGVPISVVGIILSALGRRSTSHRTMATVGLVLSSISILLTIRFFIAPILAVLVILIRMFTWQSLLFALIPVIGLILSVLGRRSTSYQTMATVGLILSSILILLTIPFFIGPILIGLVIIPAMLVGLVVNSHYLLAPYNYDLSDPGSIPNLVVQHLSLVGITMLISLIIAIPLGIFVARFRRLYLPVITVSGLLYTVPSIAAFALLIPITKLTPPTVIIPLVLYNQLVLIRNTAAAINAIDPLLIEVGRAMGMKPQQLLFRVTFPLALPVIVAGIRIATVTTVGIAALAALVGQGGLGSLIFQNIVSGDTDAVIAGAILTASFAILADLLLLSLQVVLNRGRSAVSVT